MNRGHKMKILLVLLYLFKSLIMEETLQNPLEWDKLQTYIRKSGNNPYNSSHIKNGNISFSNFSNSITRKHIKYINTMNKSHVSLKDSVDLITNKTIGYHEYVKGNSSKNIVDSIDRRFTSNDEIFKNSDFQGRLIEINKLIKSMSNSQNQNINELTLKSCKNNCSDFWNTLYAIRQNEEVNTSNNLRINSLYKTDNLLKNYICTNNSFKLANQSCLQTNVVKARTFGGINSNRKQRYYVLPKQINYSRRKTNYPKIHNSKKYSNKVYQSNYYDNEPNESPYWYSHNTKEYFNQLPPPTNIYPYKSHKAVRYHADHTENFPYNSYEVEHYNPSYSESHQTEYLVDPDPHHDDNNKGHSDFHDESKYEDRRKISRLQDMYYCSKYCHCCKKNKKQMILKYDDYGKFGRFLSIMKYFGFNSGHDLFYGRSAEQRSDSVDNPLVYLKDYYKRSYRSTEQMDDESFVFFNKEKGEPDGLSDCKEVCSCCEENKMKRLKKEAKEMEKREEKKKKKLEGLTGIIRYLLFSDDDGNYDFVDGGKEKSNGRSYSGNYYNPFYNNHKVTHKLNDYNMEKVPYVTHDQQYDFNQMDQHADMQDSTDNHESHDMEQHDNGHVEEHDHPKLILFDCSKCCRFCKKPKERSTRRRRRRQRKRNKDGKGLLDLLKELITGEAPDDSGGGDGDGGFGDYGDLSEAGLGELSLGFTAGDNEIVNEGAIALEPSLTAEGGDDSSSDEPEPCCFNSSSINPLVVVVVIALIVVQSFSSINVAFVVIVPLILFGLIIIFIFLFLQAIIPVYFVPIFIILLIMVIIPIFLLVILFLLLLPVFLFPVFFPFILKLQGGTTTTNTLTNVNSIICARNSTINCTMDSQIQPNNSPVYVDDSTETIDYFNGTTLEVTTDLVLPNYDNGNVPPADDVRQLRISQSLYGRIRMMLEKDRCLERAGCHLAIFTHSIASYNRFILRILENLSQSMNDTRFTAYKDAYQIGSLNISHHETCATLYYCKKLKIK